MSLTLASNLLPHIRNPLRDPTAESFQIILNVIAPKIQWINFQNGVLNQLGLYFNIVNKTRATIGPRILGDWLVTFDKHIIAQQQQIEDVNGALKHLASARVKLTSAPSMKHSEWQTDSKIYERDLKKLEVVMGRIVEETYSSVDNIVLTPAVDSNAYTVLTHTRPKLLTPAMLMLTYIKLSPEQRRKIFVPAIGLWEMCLGREAASPEFVDAYKRLVKLCAEFRAAQARFKATGESSVNAGAGAAQKVPNIHDSEMTDRDTGSARTVPSIQDNVMTDQPIGAAQKAPGFQDTEMTGKDIDAAPTVAGTQATNLIDQPLATTPIVTIVQPTNSPEQPLSAATTAQPSIDMDVTEDVEAAYILLSMRNDTRHLRQEQDQAMEENAEIDEVVDRAVKEAVRGINERVARDSGS